MRININIITKIGTKIIIDMQMNIAEERERFFILKRNNFVDFIKKIIDEQSGSGNTLSLLEEWANKTYPELQAEASKLRVIMMMGMEDQLVRDTLVKYGLSKDKILPEEKKKLGRDLKLFAKC